MFATIVTFSVLTIISSIVTAVAYTNKRRYLAPSAKLIASLCFMIVAIISIWRSNNFNSFGIFILCALGSGMLGDTMLLVKEFFHDNESWFFLILGVLFFSLGHIIYATRILILAGSFRYYLLVITLLVPIMLFSATKLKWLKIGKFAPVMGAYAILLTFTFIASLNLILTSNTPLSRMLLTASVFFLLSDMALCFHYFGEEKLQRATNYFIMIGYYIAQLLFALCINLYIV